MKAWETEFARVQRVSDMMVTMHSDLRDNYAKKARTLDVVAILAAVTLVAFGFADPQLLAWMPWSEASIRIVMGGAGVVALAMAVLGLLVDWKGKRESHALAAHSYSSFLQDCRRTKASVTDEEHVRALLEKYAMLGQLAAAIPENEFVKLKKKHYTKVMVSKFLDRNPGALLLAVRLAMLFRHTKRAVRGELPEP